MEYSILPEEAKDYAGSLERLLGIWMVVLDKAAGISESTGYHSALTG